MFFSVLKRVNRNWLLTQIDSAEELATMLGGNDLPCCAAYSVKGQQKYVFVNDSGCNDKTQRFIVMQYTDNPGRLEVLHSDEFSLLSREERLLRIKSVLNGECEKITACLITIQNAEKHGKCTYCPD